MRRMLGAALAAVIVSVGTPTAATERPADAAAVRAAANLKVFDAAWRRVQRSYYDRRFHGVDWRAARSEFRPMAAAAVDERGLYAVLDTMFLRLLDQHARTSSPTAVARRAAEAGPQPTASSQPPAPSRARRAAEARDGVWLVRLDAFAPGSAAWLSEQLARAPRDAPLVLDLRGNRGGFLAELRDSLTCLAPERWTIARTRDRFGRSSSLRAGACPQPRTGQLVVLVDRRSLSSAELFAAALQESGRATVVGETTGGAVLASREYALPDGGRVSVSVGDAWTGDGVRLEGRGVRPDVEAATSRADQAAGRDPALDRALATAAGR